MSSVSTFDPHKTATPSQRRVLGYVRNQHRRQERAFVWWMGGVRSGKSFGACMALLVHLQHRVGKKYMVLAFTAGQALNIFGNDLVRIAEWMGLDCKLSRAMNNPRLVFKESGNEILFRGADKEGRDKAIQGLTLDGLIADEVPNLHRATLHQAEARVSGVAALRIYTSNKTSPYHWTTKYYHDRLKEGEIEGLLVDSTVADNANVDASYVAERTAEFTGATLTRFMENQFTLDAPPIYRPVTDSGKRPKMETAWTAIYGHATGFEVVSAGQDPERLYLLTAASFGGYADLKDVFASPGTILLNASQAILARNLRRAGHVVKGYPDDFRPIQLEVLKEACRRHKLWLHEKTASLWEAIHTYQTPGHYTFPIIRAIEALSFPLKSHVS